jgi:hypothetical protein
VKPNFQENGPVRNHILGSATILNCSKIQEVHSHPFYKIIKIIIFEFDLKALPFDILLVTCVHLISFKPYYMYFLSSMFFTFNVLKDRKYWKRALKKY